MGKLSYMQTLALREQGFGEKVIISCYPDKGRKFSIVRKVCSRVDRTGSAILRKQGSGRPATASACAVCHCKTICALVGPAKLKNNVSKTLIVKNQTVIDCLQLTDTWRGKMTSFPKSCIFIFWVNTQNVTAWKINEKLMPFDEILR